MTTFPFSLADPVQFDAPLPDVCDVVIIGGGVIGVATALFLARKGASVALLEKGRIAAEQSSRNWGWIRQQGRDADELPIMMESRRLWKSLADDCAEDIGLAETGVAYLARTDAEMQEFAEYAEVAQTCGLESRLLDAAETAAFIPAMAQRYRGAITTPSDMRAEPWVAVPALARLAVREGVTIIENCAARNLDIAAGRIAGVYTEKGRVAASTVLVAAGAWTSLFLRAHGASIPQLSVKSTVAATTALPEIHAGAATDERISFRRRQDGGYTVAAGGRHHFYLGPDALRHAGKYWQALRKNPFGTRFRPSAPQGYPDAWRTPRVWRADETSPFEAMRILDPAPDPEGLKQISSRFRKLFPQIQEVTLKARWAGMIDAMPDMVPVVDHVASIPGLVVATGMSGHGFGIGPGMGRVIADLIRGDDVGHDLRRFRFSRFSDGSPLRLGPAL